MDESQVRLQKKADKIAELGYVPSDDDFDAEGEDATLTAEEAPIEEPAP